MLVIAKVPFRSVIPATDANVISSKARSPNTLLNVTVTYPAERRILDRG